MKLRVHVDRDRCVGHGLCYATAPELFAPDDIGCAHATRTTVPADGALAEAAHRAAGGCPEEAIQVGPDHSEQEAAVTAQHRRNP